MASSTATDRDQHRHRAVAIVVLGAGRGGWGKAGSVEVLIGSAASVSLVSCAAADGNPGPARPAAGSALRWLAEPLGEELSSWAISAVWASTIPRASVRTRSVEALSAA